MAEPGAGREAESGAEPVDWPALMRLGLGALRLPPEAFWAMTPGEFRRALEGAGLVPIGGGARSMDRGRLAELMAAFPDRGGRGARPAGGGAAVRASTHPTAFPGEWRAEAHPTAAGGAAGGGGRRGGRGGVEPHPTAAGGGAAEGGGHDQ
jgi:uncharacterized phage protein (TIGR02216 family)